MALLSSKPANRLFWQEVLVGLLMYKQFKGPFMIKCYEVGYA